MSMHQSDYLSLVSGMLGWFGKATTSGMSSQSALENVFLSALGAAVSVNMPVFAPLAAAAEQVVSGLINPPTTEPAAPAGPSTAPVAATPPAA